MSYSAQNIRNVALLGHSGNGKTSLVESMLYITGSTDRLGSPADGNTVGDYDPEEVKRKITIKTSVIPVEYNGCKINILDTPGNFDFVGEVDEAIRVADAGILVCDCKENLSVGTERAWKQLKAAGKPCLIYMAKTDEENGDFNAAFETLRNNFGKNIAPLVAPIWDDHKHIVGIVDVVHKRAFAMGKKGTVESEVPEEKEEAVSKLYDQLMESVAETSEEFMEKYFDGEEFTYSEIVTGLRAGVRDRSLIPVFCGSAVTGLGTIALMNAIVDLLPNPLDAEPEMGENEEGEQVKFIAGPGAYPAAFVFKTVSDQYGKFSYVKVVSGTLRQDQMLIDTRSGSTEKIGRLYSIRGKKNTEVKEITCGDIGAIGKMEKVRTSDTLCDPKGKVVKLAPVSFPEPNYSKSITPKTRGQDDKVVLGLQRMNEEDRTFTLVNNAETHQLVVTAMGDIQLDVLVCKLKSRFNVETVLGTPRVAYREKIRKKVAKQGRHKKQTGGAGQFGDVWIEFEPGEQEEMEFCERVVGGSVPKNFFPAVEKGLREACQKGPLAGYPVVYLKATLYDGSYHPVDSNDNAFRTAAQLAYKAAMPEANPVLLEPIGELKVTVPDTYMGDIMGDLNKRRGRVMGMDPADDGNQVITAEVPMSEMMSYAVDLRAMTQSRGTFTFHFVRYEECPPAAQAKAIEEAKALADA